MKPHRPRPDKLQDSLEQAQSDLAGAREELAGIKVEADKLIAG